MRPNRLREGLRSAQPKTVFRGTPMVDRPFRPTMGVHESGSTSNQGVEMFHTAGQARLKGSWRSGLPVSRATALANAGASGGRPGSPMPVGGSALGTTCTAI